MSKISSMQIALDVHTHLAPIIPERLAGFEDIALFVADLRLVLDGRTIGIKQLFQPDALLR